MYTFCMCQIFLLGGLGILNSVWQMSACKTNEEDENKQNADFSETGNSKYSEHGDQFNEDDYVTINSAGEVFPLHLDPAHKPVNETPILKIKQMRVVGGRQANPGEVPYQISIQFNERNRCGGTIYNSKTIITAAHCFHDRYSRLPIAEIESYKYVAGEFNIASDEGNEQSRKVKAANVIFHPGYNPSRNLHDIAIVSLSEPFTYNKYVQPLPIANWSGPIGVDHGQTAMISGWGYTVQRELREYHRPYYFPDNLKEAIVSVFTPEECFRMFAGVRELLYYARAGLICAGKEKGSVDGCQGDSGGPLACFNPKEGNRRFLCGIVATGWGCGLPGKPGLYTRVSDHHDWIIQNAGNADRMTIDDSRDSIQLS